MSLLPMMTSRIGRVGAVLGAALGIATMTTAAKPAQARVWVGFGIPAYTYAPPAPPAYRPPPYVYGYPYSYGYPSVGFYVGDGWHGWHRHHWRDRDDWDDDD